MDDTQAYAVIDLSAIRSNYMHAKALAPHSKTMAMIKGDAYGHGLIPVASSLSSYVDGLAVANIKSAVKLRQHGIGVNPLLVLQGANTSEAWALAKMHNIQLMIQSYGQLQYILSDKWPASMMVWILCDTGMKILGLDAATVREAIPALFKKFGRENFVICSHFACSDEVGAKFNEYQLTSLQACIDGYDVQWSMANSSAVLSYEASHGAWNRTGYMIYGNAPMLTAHPNVVALRPAMSVSAPIIALRHLAPGEAVGYSRTWTANRPSIIATVAIGYGDGYPRTASNGTPVLIRNQRATLAGRVSMDLITIDVTDIHPPATLGERVLLWGEGLSVNEVGQWAGTNGCEVLTRLTPRLQRRYINSSLDPASGISVRD